MILCVGRTLLHATKPTHRAVDVPRELVEDDYERNQMPRIRAAPTRRRVQHAQAALLCLGQSSAELPRDRCVDLGPSIRSREPLQSVVALPGRLFPFGRQAHWQFAEPLLKHPFCRSNAAACGSCSCCLCLCVRRQLMEIRYRVCRIKRLLLEEEKKRTSIKKGCHKPLVSRQ